jgi:hypothetical protein
MEVLSACHRLSLWPRIRAYVVGQILFKFDTGCFHEMLPGSSDVEPYWSITKPGYVRACISFSMYPLNRFTDTVDIVCGRRPLKVVASSVFLPYWTIIRPDLHKAIKRLFHVSHKLIYRFGWNSIWDTSTENVGGQFRFSVILSLKSLFYIGSKEDISVNLTKRSSDFV